MPSSSHRTCPSNSCLTLSHVSRADTGVYTCSADNGVGQPDTATINLTVQCEYYNYAGLASVLWHIMYIFFYRFALDKSRSGEYSQWTWKQGLNKLPGINQHIKRMVSCNGLAIFGLLANQQLFLEDQLQFNITSLILLRGYQGCPLWIGQINFLLASLILLRGDRNWNNP